MGTSDYLSALNYGTSTGGAAGSAETTSTLGTNRLDVAVPASAYNTSHLQLARMRDLLQAISQDLKGGTRLLCRVQSSNPFGATESGYYVDNSGIGWLVYNGARTQLGAHEESGRAAFSSGGSGSGSDYVDVTFTTDFANTSYTIELSIEMTTITDPIPAGIVSGNKATSGFRIQPAVPFDGYVSWRAKV